MTEVATVVSAASGPPAAPPFPSELSLSALAVTLEQAQDWLATTGLRILVTIVLAGVALWALRRLINRVVATMTSKSARRLAESGRAGRALATATGLAGERQRQRVETVGSLLRSICTFVVVTLATLTIMALLGIPLAPLLASAGVAGVALGFGAQSLVKDFLSGVFMILEDQYGVGDVIDTGEAIGTVEEVTLRITRLRDANGVTWYVRNGEIIRIGNTSQGFATAIVDMPVSYAESVEHVVGVIRETVTAMGEDPDWADKFIEEPRVLGVESIVGMTMTIRTIAQCVPGENFAVQREMRERLKAALDAADVKAPPVGPFGGPVGGPP
ncbi:MAG TPA: mechanosensitive ion channel family protein [Ornithinibacter sp.]|nr:mechanosensitive ion channel family protein [Ornithinibacter sp.]